MSRISDLGNELTDLINDAPSGTFDASFTAIFQYEADYTIPDLETTRVVVVPASVSKTREGRRRWARPHVFHVGVVGDVSAAAETGIDDDKMNALLGVVEDLDSYLQDTRGATSKAVVSEPIVNDPPYDYVYLEVRKFVSVLEVTLRLETDE